MKFIITVLFLSLVFPNFILDQSKTNISYTGTHPFHEWTGATSEVQMTTDCELMSLDCEATISVPVISFMSGNDNRDSFARIFEIISREYSLTKKLILEITDKPKLLSADPALQLSVNLRNRTIVPLGFLQVALLKRLRDQNRQPPISEDMSIDSTQSSRTYSRSELLRGALLTINGIAAGMRNTG